MTEQHTLRLKSLGRREREMSSMVFLAECSCGEWAMDLVTGAEARWQHAAHLQEHLGPDRAGAGQ
jgi:hypothetical protein